METESIPRIEAPLGRTADEDEVQNFADHAYATIEAKLSSNRTEAARITDVEQTLDEVLANNNTRSLELRARDFENPRVTLWLKDCPTWANDAWTDTIHPNGLNAYNGRVQVTFDVRPF